MARKEMQHRQPVPLRNPSIGPLSELISIRMRRVDILLTRCFAEAEAQLRPGLIAALGLIVGNPGISQAELALRSGTDKSIVVGIVNTLEERGWATRKLASDRRRHALHITPAGRAELDRIVEQARASEATMLAAIAPEELAFLRYLLDKMHASCMDALLPRDADTPASAAG